MSEETSLEFRLSKTDETRDYLLKGIRHNDLMSEKYIKTCKYLNYVGNLLISISTVNGCVSNYLLKEIKYNDVMSEKYIKTCKYLYNVGKVLVLVSTITGCVSISAFASLVCVPVGITSSAVGMKICSITAGIKKYKSIIEKKKKRKKRKK